MGKGRVIYTAFGHRAEAFAEPETKTLLANAVAWSIDRNAKDCAPAAEGSKVQ
jgi:type 1 glutamine amidotransferase